MLSIAKQTLSRRYRQSTSVIRTLQHQFSVQIDKIQQDAGKIRDIGDDMIDVEDGDMFDIVGEYRTEYIYDVEPAKSVNNLFSGSTIPQNRWMADNNWNSPHQDSYCSESVGLDGPNGDKVKLIKQYNPYGFVPTMVCNKHNQLIGVSFKNGLFRLITFDKDCNILTANVVNTPAKNSFGGGYFYLDHNNDTIVVSDEYHLSCYNTSDEIKKEQGELERKWISESLKTLMEPHGIEVSSIYSTLPVWGADGNTYWVLMPGSFNYEDNNTTTNPIQVHAFIAVMEIIPNSAVPHYQCDTKLLDYFQLKDQYVNNTLAVDEDGVYFVTNEVEKYEDGTLMKYKCDKGKLIKLKWDNDAKKISGGFQADYDNAGYIKYGMANCGSGTTPTIFKLENDPSKQNFVAINDNANPNMNVCIYDCDYGELLSKVPVLTNMRSADEASFIGVNGRVCAENNFGHKIKNFVKSQYVANEPGMTMIDFNYLNDFNHIESNDTDKIVWEKQDTCFFAMSMLCRESGIIYAYTCDWYNDDSSTKGGMFYISAIDSFDGRTVWRIPIGRGHPYQHSVGGVYFDRTGNNLLVGTYDFLVSIQNFGDNNNNNNNNNNGKFL